MKDGSRARSDAGAFGKEIRQLRVAVLVLALGLVVIVACMLLGVPPAPAVLAVERLEIVEPDGSLAFVLANSERPVGGTMDGQVILEGQEEERRGVPSIVFFDGKGDEVGGLLTGVRTTADGYSAIRHLSLDGYKQDQTVVLAHYQDPGGSSAGLRVSDRSQNLSLLGAMEQLGLESGASREQLQAALAALPDTVRAARLRELFGVQRLFLGSTRERNASLVLHDGEGRPRIVIEVTEAGDAAIRVLDEDGATVLRLPS